MKNIRKTAIVSLISILILAAIGPFSLVSARRTFQIEITANLNYGSISYTYDGNEIFPFSEGDVSVPVFVNKGVTITITPGSGYHIEDILKNGASVLSEPVYGATTFTFTKVKEDYSFEVKFLENVNVGDLGNAATIGVLTETSSLIPGFDSILGVPGLIGADNLEYFFEIEVEGDLAGIIVNVTIHYDGSNLTDEEENELRLFIGNEVDFCTDGTINGNDVSVFQEVEKNGPYNEIFDLNNDNEVNNLDEAILKEYVNSGIVVSPGNYDGEGEVRLPWIDITAGRNIDQDIIWGYTWHLSIFGCR